MRRQAFAGALATIVLVAGCFLAAPAGGDPAGGQAGAAAKKGKCAKGKGKTGPSPKKSADKPKKRCKKGKKPKKPVAPQPTPAPAPTPIGPPAPTIDSTSLTLFMYFSQGGGVEGITAEILSGPRCVVGRTVNLFEVRAAGDRLVDTVQVGNNSNFQFAFAAQTAGDVFYASADLTPTCGAAVSNTIAKP